MSRMDSLKKNGIALMVVASFLFSVMGALAKFAMARLPHTQVVFFRAVTCLPFLAVWLLHKKQPFFGRKNFPLLLLRSVAGFTSLMLTFYTTQKIDLGTASVLNFTSILFVALLSVLFLGERVSAKLVFLIVTAFAGACFIIKPGNTFNMAGLSGLGAGFFAAVAYVSIKKLHDTESFVTMVFNFMFFASLFSLTLFGKDFIWPNTIEWVALLALGVAGTVAQLFMTYSYKLAEASVVSPYGVSAVLFSSLWGIIFWGDHPDLWSIVGSLMIVLSGLALLKIEKVPAVNLESD